MGAIGRTIAMLAFIGAIAGTAEDVRAQAGFPPPAAGMAPAGPDNAAQQHFEIQRQQKIQRQQFDQFQQDQRRMTDQNLETLRRQDAAGRRARNADRAEQLERERRLATEQGRQIQSRTPRPSQPAPETRVRREPFPSIMIEGGPRRPTACRQVARRMADGTLARQRLCRR
jgi:hypothetical protein